MSVKPVPEGFHTVTPYLVVPGVAKVLDFLKRAFDAVEIHRTERLDGSIMHAEVRIGDSAIMMGEPMGDFGAMPGSIYLYVENCDALYQRAIQEGAASVAEPTDQFYGDRNAGVKDAAGNIWWIGTHIEDVSPEEIERRAAEYIKEHPASREEP